MCLMEIQTLTCQYVKTSPLYYTKLLLVVIYCFSIKEIITGPKNIKKNYGELFFGLIPKMSTPGVQIYLQISKLPFHAWKS